MSAATHEKPEFAGRPRFGGDVAPDLSDRVVNDVRAGFSLRQIAARQDVAEEVALSLILRGYAHGFLTKDEAMRIAGGEI
ncbi:hypothetical protein [Rhodoblastus sp.]|uniref:hypothetical protein n=1 Tax=Rhodoblastus sp. TaxID=1962975 RepID=UPI003F9CD1A3